MQIWKLTSKNHKTLLTLAAKALQQGKVVVYPTDTAYALGASVKGSKAIAKMYKIKLRGFKKPVHVFMPSVATAKKYVQWNATAEKLAKAFLPGPLSIVLPLKSKSAPLKKLSAKTGYLGIRIAKNKFALALTKKAGPLTATSANPSGARTGGFDPYSVEDIVTQFEHSKHKPDIIIDAGRLKKVKPSTFVKISPKGTQILRQGPISTIQILKALKFHI